MYGTNNSRTLSINPDEIETIQNDCVLDNVQIATTKEEKQSYKQHFIPEMSAIPEYSQSILDDTVVEVGLTGKRNQAKQTFLYYRQDNIELAQTPQRELSIPKPESKPV